ncbi:GTP pyrophosphokinase [Roseomonas xinghualingensis]|uniref:GTP pyrophosphokinase n=1 Tax=Roseomonas xinghualingensis TaxID=2986475 RepID=UPI0021F1E425|nr:RelA/SpoT domain-containing protein [Roseomonas sp. SXEYE001]MCV4207555.1 RelA/SpoT domain-containing protein [Roseomonas sp. SXEYE001]
MTKEEEFLARWSREKDAYLAWGQHISDRIIEVLAEKIAPVSVDYYLKTKVLPRLKDDLKLVTKAFFRNKPYAHPYDDITDKVGTRFVVLRGTEIRPIVDALVSMKGWTSSKDRDYEEEQNKNPVTFEYAAVHFVIRPVADQMIGGILVPAGTPCEVQIKTILQHAYSELTHDTIYKPQIRATPAMQRNAAKAMALLEATNDYFEKVAEQVTAAVSAVREITSALSGVYREATGLEPSPSLLEGLLLEAYEPMVGSDYVVQAQGLLTEKPFLVDRIRSGVQHCNPLFSQPSILLAYLDIATRGRKALTDWPLTEDEMEPLLNHLGESRF